MTGQIKQIAGCVIAGTNHVVDAVVGDVSTTLQALPIARWRGIHCDLCVGRIYCALRLLPRAPQGVRHRGPCVPLDFRRMAELAAARASRLAYDPLRRNLRIGTCKCAAAGLSSSRENDSHENAENNEQLPRSTFRVHGSAGIHGLRVKASLLANTDLASKISENVAETVAADFGALSPLE